LAAAALLSGEKLEGALTPWRDASGLSNAHDDRVTGDPGGDWVKKGRATPRRKGARDGDGGPTATAEAG
jgi:hypothetical protein